MRNKLPTIIFCAMLAAASVLGALLPDKYYSENERRTLKQLPEPSVKSVFSGKFGGEIEQYLSDQFPARDGWVTLKTLSELALGKRESGGVYFADDGYLIEAHKSLNARQLTANVAAVKRLSDELAGQGITLRVMLVPTADQVLTDKLPAFAPCADQSAVIEYAAKQGLNVVDVTDMLRAHKDEYIYYKTDHHWTSLGAYYAYAEWLRSKGGEVSPLSEWNAETLCDNFRGTTYFKVNYPFAPYDEITAYYKSAHAVSYNNGSYSADSVYERKFLNGSDQYAVFLNSNQAQTVISGTGKGRLLIIKDSYANTFAQFPAEDYEQTHLIDPRFFRGNIGDYAAENGITEALLLYNIPNFAVDTAIAMGVQ
ncbi:MAG: DHHW family protein [Lachnospiraceae bacterium]|nr:DHHW family protein [Ruminococcus sp.]MCM1276381.1 DHHW family protein [Lachnospiraceae bacterium]